MNVFFDNQGSNDVPLVSFNGKQWRLFSISYVHHIFKYLSLSLGLNFVWTKHDNLSKVHFALLWWNCPSTTQKILFHVQGLLLWVKLCRFVLILCPHFPRFLLLVFFKFENSLAHCFLSWAMSFNPFKVDLIHLFFHFTLANQI